MGDFFANPYQWVSKRVVPRPPKGFTQFQFRRYNSKARNVPHVSSSNSGYGSSLPVKPSGPTFAATNEQHPNLASYFTLDKRASTQSSHSDLLHLVNKSASKYKYVRTPPLGNLIGQFSACLPIVGRATEVAVSPNRSLYKYKKDQDHPVIQAPHHRPPVTNKSPKSVGRRRSFRSRYKLVHQSVNINNRIVKNSKAAEGEKLKVVTRYAIRTVSPEAAYCRRSRLTDQKTYQSILLKYRRRPLCIYFIRTGKCSSGSSCHYVHDPAYVRICPKYLNHSCALGENVCPLAHVLDPCRLPLCEFHETTGCHRDPCPYLHTAYPPNTPACPEFLKGRCPRGRSCSKKHVWKTKTTTTHRKSIRLGKTTNSLIKKMNIQSIRKTKTAEDQQKCQQETSLDPLVGESTDPTSDVPEGSLLISVRNSELFLRISSTVQAAEVRSCISSGVHILVINSNRINPSVLAIIVLLVLFLKPCLMSQMWDSQV
ncbi:Zinc finger CCCH domain-containing protein 3 [Fasciola hepatica]|uniref:Zinc finger CCCH domain-containing protein 3 n=1 Tax=Fasciola hepatica TaxID=6192 RepID=A0A4E0RD77_FASHE|nr:Zinc finger CCCH domain-containing protein 3 [Fasciola hepatica]